MRKCSLLDNDHGGPLIFGEGVSSTVIGIISACLIREKNNKCYGPFLYTSIFKNRVLINCAIYKDEGRQCNKLFRASATYTEVEMSWDDHPDGPAKNKITALRTKNEDKPILPTNKTITSNITSKDPKESPSKLTLLKTEKLSTENKTIKSNNTSKDPEDSSSKITLLKKDKHSTENKTITTKNPEDSPYKQAGMILRAHDEEEDKKDALIAKLKAVNKTKT